MSKKPSPAPRLETATPEKGSTPGDLAKHAGKKGILAAKTQKHFEKNREKKVRGEEHATPPPSTGRTQH